MENLLECLKVKSIVGRGKNKNMMKMIGPIILAVGAKLIALIPLFLGGLVLLATKALVVAKIAFFMAAALTAHKLIGGGAGLNLLSKVRSPSFFHIL